MNLAFEALGSNPELFQNELARLQTFVEWPNPAVRPEDLAKAGFVHLNSDKVQCVYCNVILDSWEAGDIPLEEHRKYSSRCPLFGSDPLHTLQRGIDVAGTGVPSKASHPRKKSAILNKNVIPHHAPLHPEYGTLDSRVKSFDSWPSAVNMPHNAECMAEAGLFYTGTMDFVSCFHCGQGLKDWEMNDDPWEEHARWHPTCELILLKKGQAYVEKAKQKHSTAAEMKGNDDEVSKSAEDRKILIEFMKSPESQEILRMGIDQSEIERTIKAQTKNLQMADIVMLLMGNTKSKTSSKGPSAASNDTRPLADDSEIMERELRNCILCTIQERCVTFLPCGHFSTCADCTLMLSDCPVCRQHIETVVKTYMP